MLQRALTVTAFLLAAGAASAQTPAVPPAPPPPASPVEAAPIPGPAARPAQPRPPGAGSAWIRVRAPGGAEIAVRCAEGDSTRACADIVSGLAEKLMSAGERRREADRDMSRGEMGRGSVGREGGRERDMERGDMDEREGDRRDRFRGEDRHRGWQ